MAKSKTIRLDDLVQDSFPDQFDELRSWVKSDASVPNPKQNVLETANHLLYAGASRDVLDKHLHHQKEKSDLFVTILYIGGILLLIGLTMWADYNLPLWYMGPEVAAFSDTRFIALAEQLKSAHSLYSNLNSGLMTALGIGIGYFFRRGGTPKE